MNKRHYKLQQNDKKRPTVSIRNGNLMKTTVIMLGPTGHLRPLLCVWIWMDQSLIGRPINDNNVRACVCFQTSNENKVSKLKMENMRYLLLASQSQENHNRSTWSQTDTDTFSHAFTCQSSQQRKIKKLFWTFEYDQISF